ncbi:uncharacterized protein Dwil_GK12917 [Drosophila willistoni]|uniref:Phenoloxidase-activating factor 2 n=1 Tax=Drosophila willistoni TaxID=7260 RepID=A0A0Q9X2L0_DROWI|nr:phenoloxidase-activating factor 2 [Drosophila willistoni]KRG00138.1 uncharacterized protein Dwil_GK12917 [Drosophila willistoni]
MRSRNQFFIVTLSALFAIFNVECAPQAGSIADKNIKDIFNTNPSVPTPSGGIGKIVQPDTGGPSIIGSISGKSNNCQCVVYYMCDPSTNSVTEPETFDGFGEIDIRFGNDDPVCELSVEKCCALNRTLTEVLNPKPLEQRPNRPTGCGIRNVNGLDFTLGSTTDDKSGFGEFPWTIALLRSGNATYFCAGSLIHPQVVMTAVHCVIGQQPGSFVARAGEWDSQTTKERLPYQEQSVQRIITHPNYKSRNVANDFALLILSQPFILGDHINVVCLPQQNASPAPGTSCFSSGWGKDVFGASGKYSAIMKRVPLPVVDFDTCQHQFRGTRLGPKFALDRSFMCAGGQRGVDTCQGDGGAPLACPIGIPSENRYQLSGMVAWGIGCNDDVPAAYANVALARSWIDDRLLENGLAISDYAV